MCAGSCQCHLKSASKYVLKCVGIFELHMGKIKIVAHRGGKTPFHENSLEAFRYSIEHGADAVEMDMRYDHYKQRFYLEHDFIHLPKDRENTISKIIPFLPEHTNLVIELKTLSWLRKRYALEFLEVVKEYKLTHRAIMISYNPFVLLQLRRFKKDLQIGFICPSHFRAWLFRKWIYLMKPQILFMHRRIWNDQMINFARSKKCQIYGYTANKEEEWLKAKELELDGLVTDYPEEAKKVLFPENEALQAKNSHTQEKVAGRG